jgi:hypothetical protein
MVTADTTVDHGVQWLTSIDPQDDVATAGDDCDPVNDQVTAIKEAEHGKASPPKAGQMSPIPRVCLSRSEAARALGIGTSTLKALERNGSAPPHFDLPGNRRRYPVKSLAEWAEKRARASHATRPPSEKTAKGS